MFDIDGTLLDHEGAVIKGIKEIYEQYFRGSSKALKDFINLWAEEHDKYIQRYLDGKISFEEQRILRLKGVFERMGEEIDEETARRYFEFYLDAYQRGWKLYSDVEPCLKGLDGYRLGVLSNGDSDQQRKKLRETGLSEYFEEVVISGDLGISKPDKRIFEEMIELMGVEPPEILYIGDDYEADFLGAYDAGINPCLIDRELDGVEEVDQGLNIGTLCSLEKVLGWM